nr:MarR family transcriptional regulator [Micromonospora jinlongensis]
MLVQIDLLSSDCHARDLADRTRLDASTVSRSVAALVAHGLVERRPDPSDKRATFLAVTPAGRAALADSHRWYGEVLARALADWTPDEVAALSAALGRFTGDIEVALGNNDNDNLEAAR